MCEILGHDIGDRFVWSGGEKLDNSGHTPISPLPSLNTRLVSVETWVSSFGQDDTVALYECEECAATFHTARYLVDHCLLQHSKKDLPEPKYANDQDQDAIVRAYWSKTCADCSWFYTEKAPIQKQRLMGRATSVVKSSSR